MKYKETLCDPIFSRHVESYWNVDIVVEDSNKAVELLLPSCTFNIIFLSSPGYLKWGEKGQWNRYNRGVKFLGQSSKCIFFSSDQQTQVLGIRFKPFALATLINGSLQDYTDKAVDVEDLFEKQGLYKSNIEQILSTHDIEKLREPLDDFLNKLLSKSMHLDEKLRAQLNYILDRQGCVRISDLISEFNMSKVTMREHFIKKVGIVPKKVSQIWRMNKTLYLKALRPSMNLTNLSLESGFYDQSHFIRDFKLLFDQSPKRFFETNDQFVMMSSDSISKRFNNVYDPRFT